MSKESSVDYGNNGSKRKSRPPNPNATQKVNQDILNIFVPLEQKQFHNSRLDFKRRAKQQVSSEDSRELFSGDAKSKLATNNGAMRIQKIIQKNSKRFLRKQGTGGHFEQTAARKQFLVKNGNTTSNSPKTYHLDESCYYKENTQVQPSSNNLQAVDHPLVTSEDQSTGTVFVPKEKKSFHSIRQLPKLDDIIVAHISTPEENVSFDPKESSVMKSSAEESHLQPQVPHQVLLSPTSLTNKNLVRSSHPSISSSIKRGSRILKQALPAIEDKRSSRIKNAELSAPQEYSFVQLSDTQRQPTDHTKDMPGRVRVVRRSQGKKINSRVSFRNQSLIGLVTGDQPNMPDLQIEKRSSVNHQMSQHHQNSRQSSQEESFFPASTFHNGVLSNDTPSNRQANNGTTQSNFSQSAQQHPKAFISSALKMPHLVKGPHKLTSPKNVSSKMASHLAIRSSDQILIQDNVTKQSPKYSKLRIDSNKIILHDLKHQKRHSNFKEKSLSPKGATGNPQFRMEEIGELSPIPQQEITSQLLNRSFMDQKRQREKRHQRKNNTKLLTYLSTSSAEKDFDYSKIGIPNSSFAAFRVQSLERPADKDSPNPLDEVNQESLYNEIQMMNQMNPLSTQSSNPKKVDKEIPRQSHPFQSFQNPPFDEPAQNEEAHVSLPSNETFMSPDPSKEFRHREHKKSVDVPSSQLNESAFQLGSRIEKGTEGILQEKVQELKLVGQKHRGVKPKPVHPMTLATYLPGQQQSNSGSGIPWSPASSTQYRERLKPLLQHSQVYKSPQQQKVLPSISKEKKKPPLKMTSRMILQEMHQMTRNNKFAQKTTGSIANSRQFRAPNYKKARDSKGFGRNNSCSIDRQSPSPSQVSSHKKQSQFASRKDTLHPSPNRGISLLRDSADGRSKAVSPIHSPRVVLVHKVSSVDKKAKPGPILPIRGMLQPQNQSKLDLLQISIKQIRARNIKDMKLIKKSMAHQQIIPQPLTEEESPSLKPRSRRCSTCKQSEGRRKEESPIKKLQYIPQISEACECGQEIPPRLAENSIEREVNTLRKPGDASETLTMRMV